MPDWIVQTLSWVAPPSLPLKRIAACRGTPGESESYERKLFLERIDSTKERDKWFEGRRLTNPNAIIAALGLLPAA
jgi:hypothetical protein